MDLLSAGPSLQRYPGRRAENGLVLAINLASLGREVDWLVMMDHPDDPSLAAVTPPGIGILCDPFLSARYAAKWPRVQQILTSDVMNWNWPVIYSAGFALGLARKFLTPGETLHVWGMDLSGSTYYDGSTAHDLGAERWRIEGAIARDICDTIENPIVWHLMDGDFSVHPVLDALRPQLELIR